MGPLALALGGAGLGLLKSELVDRPNEQRQRKMQAEIARWSPWSGMKADTTQIKNADPFGSAMQYGMAGGMLGLANADKFGGSNNNVAPTQTDSAAEMYPAAPSSQANMSYGTPEGYYMDNYNADQQQMMAKYPWLGVK